MSAFKCIEEIDIWKEAVELAIKIYKLTDSGKFNRDFSLKVQLRRSAISISSNIAEGFERETHKEFIRFLFIAKGSYGELRSQLYISQRIGYLSNSDYDLFNTTCKILSSKIQSLINYLKSLK